MYRSLLVLVLLLGCASGRSALPPLLSPGRAPEATPLPPPPEDQPLPPEVPSGSWVEPLEAGSCIPAPGSNPLPIITPPCPARAGILMSEERAWRDGVYRVRYRELRALAEVDRGVWRAQREFYEGAVRDLRTQLQAAQPGWWTRNGWAVCALGGFALGALGVVTVIELVR